MNYSLSALELISHLSLLNSIPDILFEIGATGSFEGQTQSGLK